MGNSNKRATETVTETLTIIYCTTHPMTGWAPSSAVHTLAAMAVCLMLLGPMTWSASKLTAGSRDTMP